MIPYTTCVYIKANNNAICMKYGIVRPKFKEIPISKFQV